MPTTYSLEQAMARLGMSRNRLARWCEKLHITPTDHPYERRVKLLSEDDIQRIREAAEAAQGVIVHRDMPPKGIPPVDFDHSASQGILSTPPARKPRQKRPPRSDLPFDIRTVDPATLPLLPPGWVSANSLARDVGIHRETVDRDILEGRIQAHVAPDDGGPWAMAGKTGRLYPVVTALDEDQQRAFRAHYAARATRQGQPS